MEALQQARKFLDALWPDQDDLPGQLCIWTLPDKLSRYHTNHADAATAAIKLADKHDVYLGVCRTTQTNPNKRGDVDCIVAVPGVWADIDFAHDAHKKQNLPPDEQAAHKLASAIGPTPSLIVHSGHGLQVYWLFKEPWLLDDKQQRQCAIDFARRWSATITAQARAHQWVVDSVGDLTRVFRMPGTINHKHDPKPVVLQQANKQRYNPDDLEVYLVAEEFEQVDKAAIVHVDALKLTLDVPRPPKLDALLDLDENFRKTWQRQRPDFNNDQSAYDMALANYAADAAWTDQEIADLIVNHRCKHGQRPEKGLRQDYLQKTIAKARVRGERDIALKAIEHEAPVTGMVTTAQGEQRLRILDCLSKYIGMRVERWIQRGTEATSALYYLKVAGQEPIQIGKVDVVMSAAAFRKAMYVAFGYYLDCSTKIWPKVAGQLARVVEVESIEESTVAGQISEWLNSYCMSHPPTDDWAAQAGKKQPDPFIREGQLWIHAGAFRFFVRTYLGEKLDSGFYAHLRAVGFGRKHVQLGKTTVNYYRIPLDSTIVLGINPLWQETTSDD